MADILFATTEIRRGKKEVRRIAEHKYNVRICYAGGHNEVNLRMLLLLHKHLPALRKIVKKICDWLVDSIASTARGGHTQVLGPHLPCSRG